MRYNASEGDLMQASRRSLQLESAVLRRTGNADANCWPVLATYHILDCDQHQVLLNLAMVLSMFHTREQAATARAWAAVVLQLLPGEQTQALAHRLKRAVHEAKHGMTAGVGMRTEHAPRQPVRGLSMGCGPHTTEHAPEPAHAAASELEQNEQEPKHRPQWPGWTPHAASAHFARAMD